jgi:S1-C subfamily serine protease
MLPPRLPVVSWTAAFLLGASLACPPANAQTDGGEKLYQRILKSTGWVLAPVDKNKARTGTGSLVDAHRKLLLTNYHVVGDKDTVFVLFPAYQKGKPILEKEHYSNSVAKLGVRGHVVAKDAKRDLALIQLDNVPEGVLPLKLAATSPSPGQEVHSVGNPGRSGALWVYTYGKVRAVYHKKWRSSAGEDMLSLEAEVVETQSPTNPGDSGGPLVNNRGELVAVTQGTATDASLLSLFIDVSEVRAFMVEKKVLARTAPPLVEKSLSDTPKPAEATKPADDAERTERVAASKLKLIQDLVSNGKKERAKERLAELIKEYPKTKAAAEARELLEKLKK